MLRLVGEFTPYRQLEEKLISLLARCSSCLPIKQIQGQVIAHGFLQSPYLAPKITTALFQCSAIAVARQWFDRILRPNVVLWNVMFKGYTNVGLHKETLLLFDEMMKRRREDDILFAPNAYTFTFVLKSSSFLSSLRDGEQVHCFTIKMGWFQSNRFVGTVLIDMYSSVIENAYKVFEEMPVRNVVCWTAIIRAYISVGDLESAHELFDRAIDRDVVLWNTMICGYTERGAVLAARKLFAQMPDDERDTMAWNTVLLGYANTDREVVEECESLFFEEMPADKKNVFSWNGLIGMYSRHGRFHRVLGAFNQMLFHSSSSPVVNPNAATLSAVLSACSKLGSLISGRLVHSYAAKRHHELLTSASVGNGLIDMYAKCGCIEDAMSVFSTMKQGTRDVITWNSIIGGLAAHGHGVDALDLFEQMKKAGKCKPDGITFVGVLSACVHSVGLVQRGIGYMRLMIDEYMIEPWIEHYGCVVDFLSRTGLIDEALGVIKKMSMSMKPDCVIWSTLIGACQQQLEEHRDGHERQMQILTIAELAMSRLVRLEPEDATNYVILSKMYGTCKRWADVAILKQVVNRMCSLQNKVPGWSWVQVDSSSQLVEFCSSDTRHLRTEEIYQALQGLTDTSMMLSQIILPLHET